MGNLFRRAEFPWGHVIGLARHVHSLGMLEIIPLNEIAVCLADKILECRARYMISKVMFGCGGECGCGIVLGG